MINFLELKQGDVFWQCCGYHWKRRLGFIKIKDGLVECVNLDEFGIFKKDSKDKIPVANNECFKTRNDAVLYQETCKESVIKLSKDELIKRLFNKCCSHGILTTEEEKLYRSIIKKIK